jgi:Domain of unknown function (DUF222)/HNH endonuclease
MCGPGQLPAVPSAPVEALAMVQAGLGWLAQADAASLPTEVQAELLRGLEQAESAHTAARARVLGAFAAQQGFEDDGAGSAGSWLRWQARITRGAASGAVGWMRRLAAHPAVAAALAAGEISPSWAREICAWTDKLPADKRADADQILLAAAAGGADLAGLAGLAEEMFRRTAPPDPDDDDRGFGDRGLRLDLHYQGAGKLTGDLTPECSAALTAVLESLGKKAGPEDDRTREQRDHDALEEALRRVTGAGGLPDVAGQPALVQLHVTLDQLRSLPGAADAEAAWLAGRAAADGQPGWAASRAAAEAYSCDARIVPVVTAHIDPGALAALVHGFLAARHPGPRCHQRGCTCQDDTDAGSGERGGRSGTRTGKTGTGTGTGTGTHDDAGSDPDTDGHGSPELPAATMARLTDTLLRYAADALSGPAGLASHLRTTMPGIQSYGVSLPLDTGMPTETVPAHLRRAVIARDRHCTFPGCAQRPAACQVHHLIPRSRGGPTALHNLALTCAFHHLIAIHRWGWTLALHGDGTTTAVSPDGQRTLHSHGPPGTAAA